MLDGIQSKLTSHAELLTIAASFWSRANDSTVAGRGTGLGALMKYFTDGGVVNELKNDMSTTNFGSGTNYGLWGIDKLLGTNHLYTTLFKVGAVLWGAGELGIYTKYKSIGAKIAKGAAISAIILPGSGQQGFEAGPVGPSTGGYYQAPQQGKYLGYSNMGTIKPQGY
jgi:hypothetical protein